MPAARAAAFIAPALVALMPSIPRRSSSSRRSSTPQVKAPCAPPPCRARLIDLTSTFLVDVLRGLVDSPVTTLPSILSAPCRAVSARKATSVVHAEMYGAELTGGNARRVLFRCVPGIALAAAPNTASWRR